MKKTIVFTFMVISVTACKEPKHEYSTEITNNFLKGCQVSASPSACACLLDGVQRAWSQDEFIEKEIEIGLGKIPPKFVSIIKSCR